MNAKVVLGTLSATLSMLQGKLSAGEITLLDSFWALSNQLYRRLLMRFEKLAIQIVGVSTHREARQEQRQSESFKSINEEYEKRTSLHTGSSITA